MSIEMNSILDPNKRYDAILLFDVTDGNPNGDPDAGNLPRTDPETMQGVVSDVALKRKVRDYVFLTKGEKENYDIYIKHRGILSQEQQKAYESLNINPPEKGRDVNNEKKAKEWLCQHYFDIRMFGAVLNVTDYKAGQVRGPVSVTMARSIDRVFPIDMTITRVALTNATDVKGGSEEDVEARSGQMGRKTLIPYGLYVAYVYFSPAFAKQTNVSENDLQVLWEALVNMWDLDHSATRGRMACRGLYVFSHEDQFGNAPSHMLFEKVDIRLREEGTVPRSYKDYKISIDESLPEGVKLHKVVNSFNNEFATVRK